MNQQHGSSSLDSLFPRSPRSRVYRLQLSGGSPSGSDSPDSHGQDPSQPNGSDGSSNGSGRLGRAIPVDSVRLAITSEAHRLAHSDELELGFGTHARTAMDSLLTAVLAHLGIRSSVAPDQVQEQIKRVGEPTDGTNPGEVIWWATGRTTRCCGLVLSRGPNRIVLRWSSVKSTFVTSKIGEHAQILAARDLAGIDNDSF